MAKRECPCRRGEWPTKWRPASSLQEIEEALADTGVVHDQDGDCVTEVLGEDSPGFNGEELTEHANAFKVSTSDVAYYAYRAGGRATGATYRRIETFLIQADWEAPQPVTDEEMQAVIQSILLGSNIDD